MLKSLFELTWGEKLWFISCAVLLASVITHEAWYWAIAIVIFMVLMPIFNMIVDRQKDRLMELRKGNQMIVTRLFDRGFVCPNCQAIYHVETGSGDVMCPYCKKMVPDDESVRPGI